MAQSTAGLEDGKIIQNAAQFQLPKFDHPVICVFCGASPGTSPAHLAAARALAQAFHEASVTLIYGGGTNGIMGELARTLVALSGPSSVIGVIPAALVQYEQSGKAPARETYGDTITVNSMHTRKHLMARHVLAGSQGSGFVALSGGYGTLEELMEVTTWNQLGIHDVGVVVYNVEGYWDGLMSWVKGAVKAGFINESNGGILLEATSPEQVVEGLKTYQNSNGRLKLHWEAEG